MRRQLDILWLGATLLATPACLDDSTARAALIDGPRILALESEPPEAAPGARSTYRVLAVDPDGALALDDLTFSYCQTAKRLADNRLASDACAQTIEKALPSAGQGNVPSDACARFGPNVPPTQRAPDPDATGGYYQPIRVALGDLEAVGTQRLRCQLANAPLELTRAFRERYVLNKNPELGALTIEQSGAVLALTDDLPRNRELTLRVDWPEASRERFVVYDAESVSLVEHDETLRVSWFATAGELAYDHTGRTPDDPARWTENRWRTPNAEQHVFLWLVLRDDRGGTTHASYELDVR
jgi:hypothetical protein